MKNGANPHSITSACSDVSGTAAAGAGTIGQARAASTQAHQSAMTAIWMTPVRKKKRCGTANSSRAGRVAERAPGTERDAGRIGSIMGKRSPAGRWAASAEASAVQRPASLTRVKIATGRSAGARC